MHKSVNVFRNKPKPVDIDKFGGIFTVVYFKNHVLFPNGHTKPLHRDPQPARFFLRGGGSVHRLLTHQRKIKIKYSDTSKKIIKSIKLL